jgi:uncharacterized repeat protein (TIGR03803 family)
MKSKQNSRLLNHILTLAVITVCASSNGWAAEKVLHAFNGTDGSEPRATLIWDAAGNLYGTTEIGGSANNGTVFELSKNADGSWTETVLYNFQGGSDGFAPWSGLTFDAAGNLYGTTLEGGGSTNCSGGCGTVFKLTKGSTGTWTESILYVFQGGNDAARPGNPLIFDAQGNIYGTTFYGGPTNCNTGCGFLYKLSPTASGPWTETLLHMFGVGSDGEHPMGPLVMDKSGNIFGTASGYVGAAYEFSPVAGGGGNYSVIFNFDGTRGAATGVSPEGGLIADAQGNLYGTAMCGGSGVTANGWSPCEPAFGYGNVFELSQSSSGVWTQKVLFTFYGNKNASFPTNPLLLDAAGNIYGTTAFGGNPQGLADWNEGTAFKLTPNSNGSYSETVLHKFIWGTRGYTPFAGLVFDGQGNLYGTTYYGGAGNGVVFEITP